MIRVSIRLVNALAEGRPTIVGVPRVERTLTADTSAITDGNGIPEDVVFTYQWIVGDADVPEATGPSYTVQPSDLGKTIKVRIGFTDIDGFREERSSGGTTPVEARSKAVNFWTATVTVTSHPDVSDAYGYSLGTYPGSALTQPVVTFGSASYSVNLIQLFRSEDTGQTHLILRFNQELPDDARDAWLFEVAGREFSLSQASDSLTFPGRSFQFQDTGLSWSDGDMIQLSLNAPNSPARGVAITGEPGLGSTLTADISGLTDPDGVPDGAVYTYQWIDSDGDNDADIDGAREDTYTVTGDEGGLVKVRVGFTDARGFSESVTSEGVITPKRGEVLWALLRAAAHTNDSDKIGHGSFYEGSFLSESAFTLAGQDYTVSGVYIGSLIIQIEPPLSSEAVANRLTLRVGSREFPFSDRSTTLSNLSLNDSFSHVVWEDPGLSWSVGDRIRIGLSATTDAQAEAPSVLAINAGSADGTYAIDATLSVSVFFSAAVTVSGTPQLALDIGGETRQADYASGSGTESLLFSYTVAEGDEDTDGIEVLDSGLALNGGTISAGGKAATLTHGNVTFVGVLVDGSLTTTDTPPATNTAPVFDSDAAFMADENQTAVGTVIATDADAGDTVTYAVTGGDDQARFQIDPASGDLTFAAEPDHESPTDDGTNNVYLVTVTATGGTGARALTTDQAITVTVNDVDETPAVASVDVTSTPSATADTYGLDETIEVTVTFDQAVTVTGTPRIQLRIGGGAQGNLKWANYASGSGNEALVFAYTVQAGDRDDNGIYIEANELELNNGTIQGVDDNVAAGLTYALLGTQSGHKVDGSIAGTTPSTNAAPVFTSAATFTADENQTAVGTVIATDADAGDAVSYAVTGGADQARFRIDPASGVLIFATAPDHENPTDADSNNVYLVTVTATGGTGARALTTEQSITVTVNDVDETAVTPATGDLTATVGTGKIRLEWAGSADAYEYRRKEEGMAWSAWTAAGTGGWFVLRNATTLDDYDVLAETTYTYQVREAGASDALGEAQGRLGPPITLRLDRTAYSVDEGAGELFFTVLAEAPAGWDRYDRDIRPSLTSAGVPGPLPERPSERPFSKTQEDYERLAESLIIEPGDFVPDNGRYVASRGRSIGIVDDTLVEEDETFELRLLLAGGVSRFFTLGVGNGRAEVTIVDNDTDSAPAAGNPLTGFELVDATAHLEAGAVEDGATLTDIDPDKVYGFRANVEPGSDLQSVKLELRGPGENDIATRTANDKPYSLYGDSGGHEHGATLAPGSYTLTATAHSEPGGGGSQLGTLSVEFTVAGEPLTVKFEGLPRGGHAGAGTTFTVRLSFSEAVSTTPEGLGQALEVTNATVGAVSRVDGRSDLWEVRLTPESDATVTVALSPAADCDAAGAVCTADGRMLAIGAGTAIPGPPPSSPATGAPTIGGAAEVGQVLSADATGIDDDNGLDNAVFSYQWLRSDGDAYTNIQDATESTYTLVADDEGRTIKVKVSFTDDEGNAESLTSDPTREVEAAETVPGRPQDLEGEASAQGIELTWEAPAGSAVTHYVVYRAVLEDGQLHGKPMTRYATIEATGADMAYTDDEAEAGVEYRYRVAAVNSAGEGKKSNWINIFAGDS